MTDWSTLWPVYLQSIGQTLWMVVATLVLGGILGLALGVLLYTTRRGGPRGLRRTAARGGQATTG